jgi:predicted aconitase
MKMKLTQYQQEMLDGKHGEAKQYCMDKLMDFGKAVEATEMVDLVLVLNCCPIYVKDRLEP